MYTYYTRHNVCLKNTSFSQCWARQACEKPLESYIWFCQNIRLCLHFSLKIFPLQGIFIWISREFYLPNCRFAYWKLSLQLIQWPPFMRLWSLCNTFLARINTIPSIFDIKFVIILWTNSDQVKNTTAVLAYDPLVHYPFVRFEWNTEWFPRISGVDEIKHYLNTLQVWSEDINRKQVCCLTLERKSNEVMLWKDDSVRNPSFRVQSIW